MKLSQTFNLEELGNELTALSTFLLENELPEEEIDKVLAWGRKFDDLSTTLLALYMKRHPEKFREF